MPEQPSKTICEICGGMHPTSEHPQNVNEREEPEQEWPKTDYVEDVPEAVAKGKKLLKKAKALIDDEKTEEALQALLEDEFAVAAYIAELIPRTISLSIKPKESLKTLLGDEWDLVVALGAVQIEAPKKEIWMPIAIQATLEKYKEDKKVVPRKPKSQQMQGKGTIRNTKPGGGRWAAGRSKPFSPWVQKMYEKDRSHSGKEMATRTGSDILRDIIDGLKYDIRQNQQKQEQSQLSPESEKKTTNIGPEGLNYDHYTAEKYDDDIRRSIPGYEELHQKIEDVVTEYAMDHKVNNMLDLGVGTGLTAERLLKVMPNASLTAVDRFENENMLQGAERRLAGAKVKFLIGDYSEIDFGKDYEVIESVIGIHHQTNEGKRKLFKKVFDALKPSGIFIFGDLVTYKDEGKAKDNEEKHFQSLRENARDEESLREWEHHHRTQNLLAPIEDQIEWLKEAGFSQVDVKFEHLNTALIIAKK